MRRGAGSPAHPAVVVWPGGCSASGRSAAVNEDELVYRRVFRAPRELVWRCLTEPGELAQFWGPRGMITPLDGIVVELHAGGRFETLMIGDVGSHRMVATFTEVD